MISQQKYRLFVAVTNEAVKLISDKEFGLSEEEDVYACLRSPVVSTEELSVEVEGKVSSGYFPSCTEVLSGNLLVFQLRTLVGK